MTGAHRIAVVTGAGSGIGRETAALLSHRGHLVVLLGRTESSLRETGARLPGPWRQHPCDVGEYTQLSRVLATVIAEFGRLDALVNNAACAPNTTIDGHTPEMLHRVFATNTLAPAVAISCAWNTMKNKGGGRIVNVSSMSAFDPFPGFFGYAASKAAVNMLTKTAAAEGAPLGIRVFAVAPGAVETPMLRAIVPQTELPTRRTLAPLAVASVIVECACGDRDSQSGEIIAIPSP